MDAHSYDSVEVSCETVSDEAGSEKRLAMKRLAKKAGRGPGWAGCVRYEQLNQYGCFAWFGLRAGDGAARVVVG